MSDYPVTRGAQPGDPHLRLRLAALTAVIVGVILVALAAFLFSYTGIHHIALQAGVAPGLARLYPLMFDAMLIITCSAVLATRTAGWGTKTYVWVCLLLVVGAVAVGDALHATGVHLTGQAARATIAVVPWVLLLLGFGIWLVMLRHWRRIRTAGAINGAEAGPPAQADRNGHAGRPVPAAPAGAADRAPQAGQPDRAPQAGQADQAPERPPATESPAASRTATTGQDTQRATTPGERQPAGTAATTAGTAAAEAGTAAAAAAGTAAGIAARTAAGTKPGSPGDTKPGAAEETKPETTAPTTPGPATATKPGPAPTTATTAAGTIPRTATTTAATTATAPGTTTTAPGTTAGTTSGSAETTSGTADTGAVADARAGATGSADPASTGQDNGGKDKAGAEQRRRRLGGLLAMPASADDETGSVRLLPAEPKAPPGDAGSGKDDEAGEADTPAGAAAAAAEPDPANPPAPLPHFDRPRSTPTPPRETGADEE